MGSRIRDIAQQARDAVAARVGELSPESGTQTSAASETLRDLASSVTQRIADLATDAQQVSGEKLEQLMTDVTTALPLFREAGYTLELLGINLGLIPQLHADFRVDVDVPDEQVEALLQANADRELSVLLIRAMRRASKLQEKLSFGGLRPNGLSVTVGVPPTVIVKFRPVVRSDVRVTDAVGLGDPASLTLPAPAPGTPPA